MYVSSNYKTKKSLKEALAKGARPTVFSPGPFPCPQDGWVTVEGPHFPVPHSWYGQVWVESGIVKKVK